MTTDAEIKLACRVICSLVGHQGRLACETEYLADDYATFVVVEDILALANAVLRQGRHTEAPRG